MAGVKNYGRIIRLAGQTQEEKYWQAQDQIMQTTRYTSLTVPQVNS